MTLSEFLGIDFLMDEDFQFVLLGDGTADISDPEKTLHQDLQLRLFTPYGSLFYDKEFGSHLYLFIHDENTDVNRSAFCAEVIRCLVLEPRINPSSVRCSVSNYDDVGFQVEVKAKLALEDHKLNFVLNPDFTEKEIKYDIDPV